MCGPSVVTTVAPALTRRATATSVRFAQFSAALPRLWRRERLRPHLHTNKPTTLCLPQWLRSQGLASFEIVASVCSNPICSIGARCARATPSNASEIKLAAALTTAASSCAAERPYAIIAWPQRGAPRIATRSLGTWSCKNILRSAVPPRYVSINLVALEKEVQGPAERWENLIGQLDRHNYLGATPGDLIFERCPWARNTHKPSDVFRLEKRYTYNFEITKRGDGGVVNPEFDWLICFAL